MKIVFAGTPDFAAVALEPSVVEPLSYTRILEFGERHLAWQKALRAGIEHYGVRKEKRERELLMLSPEQRYRLFLEEEPELAARIAAQVDLDRSLALVQPGPEERLAGRRERPALVVQAAADLVEADHVGAQEPLDRAHGEHVFAAAHHEGRKCDPVELLHGARQ